MDFNSIKEKAAEWSKLAERIREAYIAEMNAHKQQKEARELRGIYHDELAKVAKSLSEPLAIEVFTNRAVILSPDGSVKEIRIERTKK